MNTFQVRTYDDRFRLIQSVAVRSFSYRGAVEQVCSKEIYQTTPIINRVVWFFCPVAHVSFKVYKVQS